MKNVILFFLLIYAGSFSLKAQSTEQSFDGSNHYGKINIHQDKRIDSLLNQHLSFNKQHKKIDGYRIIIFFESGNHSKNKAFEIKSDFEENYPETPAYVSFHSPYYRVRIGDFRTRIEADKFLQTIKSDYPNAYVLKSDINYPDL